jgi:hypothetical protein
MKLFSILKTGHKIILGVILVLIIILFAAPRVARKYIVKNSVELIGRKVNIDKIRINYLTGTLNIDDLILYEDNSTTAFFSFKRLNVNLKYLPLFKNEIYISDISLDNPYVQILQDGDHFNFSDLIKSDSTNTDESDTTSGKTIKYILNNIQISKGYVKYTDMQLNNTIALNNLDLQIPGFTWNSDSTNLAVNFSFVDGGSLYSKLAINQADSSFMVHLKLDSLNLNIIQPYVMSNLNISALHGKLTNDIIIKGSMQHIMQLFIQGINHINDFQLADVQNTPILTFNDLTVDIDTFLLDEHKISLKYVGLTEPYILFEKIDSINNWLTLVKQSEVVGADSVRPTSDTVPETTIGAFVLSKMTLSEGQVQFINRSLRYPFEYSIDKIQIESTPAVRSPGKMDVHLSALLNNTGKFKTDVTFNPVDLTELDLRLSINQFRMKDVDAYFRHYFGFPVTGGLMNFTTDNKLKANSLISNNNIYFRKFTLGERSQDDIEYKIPLRLALGILSDKDGIIDLKAPVESKGKEVKINNLGKIIWRVIGNLFLKAAVSPYNLLADMYKMNPESLKEIELKLFDPMPDKENLDKIDVIADILNKKPGLNVDFCYYVEKPKVSDTLAYLMAMKDYESYRRKMGYTDKSITDSSMIAYLLDNISVPGDVTILGIPALCRKYIGEERLASKMDSLKLIQIDFLKNYLISEKEINDSLFRIMDSPSDTIRAKSGYTAFMIFFTAARE